MINCRLCGREILYTETATSATCFECRANGNAMPRPTREESIEYVKCEVKKYVRILMDHGVSISESLELVAFCAVATGVYSAPVIDWCGEVYREGYEKAEKE